MKSLKKVLLAAVIIQAFAVAYGYLMRLGISELSLFERQTFTLLVNAKEILLVALYIAWRVTSDSKPK